MPKALMGLFFFPRGGSAHVARNLAHALPAAGWDVTIVSGTSPPDGDAARFYEGLDVRAVDVEDLSFEHRLATLDDNAAERQAEMWSRVLEDAGAAEMDVLHLHHLTPLNEAAQRVAPHVPVIGHLHGTELLLLENTGRWAYGEEWAARMRGWAAQAQRLIVPSERQIDRALDLLPIDPDDLIVVPNGFDPALFYPRPAARPPDWGDGPPLLYVGRFTEVKRLPLLIEAHARARAGLRRRAPLVLIGGFPNECEGEHPAETIRRLGAEDVILAGWHEHRELPALLNAGAAIVLPSVREQFGQSLVEGMACGLPAIAADAFGPADIVIHGETGWLVEPDDVTSLANALVEVVNRPDERRRRGAAARVDVVERFAWPSLADQVAELYDATSLRHGAAPTR